MKRFVLFSALLLATPAFAADTPVDPVVREYIANTAATDWLLDGGWGYVDGVLTHYAGAKGTAQPIAPPTFEAGKTYRLRYRFSGRTQGTVTVGLGSNTVTYSSNQAFSVRAVAASVADTFTITTSADFDGSITGISVVQLGDDQSASAAWNTADGWTVSGGELAHAAGTTASIDAPLALQVGHTYELSFNVAAPVEGATLSGNGTVTLAGQNIGWFSQTAGWNFNFDFKAGADNTLAFTPSEAADKGEGFNGIIRHLNIREITSDAPAPPAPATTGAQQ